MSAGRMALLASVPLFEGLDPEALTAIHTLGVRRRLAAGRTLFHEHAPATTLYVLLDGQVRVSREGPGGEHVVLHYCHAGDVIGCAILGGSRTYPGTAEVTVDSVGLAFNEDAISTLSDRYPRVSRNALRMLSGRMEDLRVRFRELSTDRVEQRVARALLRLLGDTPPGADGFLQISRQELAELVGTTQFTASRLLSAWEREGWVHTGRCRVNVRDPQAISRIAGNTDPAEPNA